MVSRQTYDNSAHKIALRFSLHLSRAFVMCNLFLKKENRTKKERVLNVRQLFDALKTSEYILQTQCSIQHTISNKMAPKATKQFANE